MGQLERLTQGKLPVPAGGPGVSIWEGTRMVSDRSGRAGLRLVGGLVLALAVACGGHGSSGTSDGGGACDGSTCGPQAGADGGTNLATLDPTVPSNLAFSSAFLYSGSNPVQTGVAAGTIDITRVSVIRGQVQVRSTGSNATDGLAPLAGVTVTVLGHPELGSTKTQSDGWYSMAVNGGGPLTVVYSMTGYLPVQRQAQTRWLQYAITNPAVLTSPEPGTPVTLSASSTDFQVVRGKTHGTAASLTPTDDADGARTATIMVPPGAAASIDGLNDVATTFRATEVTTGSSGRAAMPADLPPTSQYTYAVDLSIDEANGASVTFSKPVLFYVDNFIGFPVGDGHAATTVPSGYYDTTKGTWVPSTSGQIAKVLTNVGDTVTLDTTGTGKDTPDSAFTPPLVAGERAQIAKLYKVGASFWRVGMAHFSIWDLNWGSGPPSGAVAPDPGAPSGNNPDDNPCTVTGSIIECENQILAEEFPVTGAPFTLRYQSERTPGRQVSVNIPTTGSMPLPPVVEGIEVTVQAQGRQWVYPTSHSLAANQFVNWTWDRKDAFGRLISGHTDVSVAIGYDYNTSSSYQATGQFGAWGGSHTITGNRALRQITIWTYFTFPVDQIDARTTFGLGGLSLSAQHVYDTFGQTFYGGDGSRRTVNGESYDVIESYAGGGNQTPVNGIHALDAQIVAQHVAVGPDGSLYIGAAQWVLKVDTHGVMTIVAGNGQTEANITGDPGDGHLATSVAMDAYGVAVGPDNTVYITTGGTNRVQKIDPTSGILTTIAGSGLTAENCVAADVCADGANARSVGLGTLGGLAYGPDGAIYFSESFVTGQGRVRRIGLDGKLSTLITDLDAPDGIAFGPDGSLYVVDNTGNAVKRLTPSGTLSVVAGGDRGSGGDGGPASAAGLFGPVDVAVAPDGSFYVTDAQNCDVRFVNTAGNIYTLTNPNARALATFSVTDDGGPAGSAVLYAPGGLALGPRGQLYIADGYHYRVRVITPPLPGFSLGDAVIPSKDGTTVFQFDETGKHQHTYDALRGQTLATLAYDTNGLLKTLTDNAGNVTRVDRSQPGKIVLTAPFGQTTTLTLDASGYAKSIANPNAETTQLTYGQAGGADNGLLQTLTDPKGQVHQFDFTSDGLLSEDDNPAGGQRKLVLSNASATGWTVTHTTKMGYVSTYAITTPPVTAAGGAMQRVVTTPTGATSSYAQAADGSRTSTLADATGTTLETSLMQLGADPRYGMLAPIVTSLTTTLEPSGLAMSMTHTRTVSRGSSLFDLKTQTDVVTLNPGDAVPEVATTTYTSGSTTNTVVVRMTTGRSITATLDANDRVIALAVPGLASRTLTYNTAACPAGGEGCGGRLTSVTSTSASDGTRTWTNHYRYSPDTGFLSSVVDALGESVSWKRDPVGRPLTTQLPTLPSTTAVQNQVGTTFDLNGNLSTLSVPSTASAAPEHQFPLYSPIDLLETYSPPALSPALTTSSTSYAYNADAELTSIQLPDTSAYQTVGVSYDSVGRLTQVADSKSGVTRHYGYSPGSELQSVTTSDGETLTYGYGVDGPMLMSETWSGTVSGSVSVTHDALLRIASRSVNGGPAVTYQFDGDGLFAATSGLTTMTVARDYGGKNGLVTGTTAGSISDAYTYNGFGELKSYTASVSGTPLYTTTITARDGSGRLQGVSETANGVQHTWSFAYDPHGGLSSVTEDGAATAFTYDPNGNRLSSGGQSSTYDAQDRLESSPGATYTYTNNGDLLTKVTAAGTTTYAYDLLSALRAVSLPSGDTVAYTIDGQGRRVGKVWTHAGTAVSQGFLYDDQLRIAAELDGQGNVVSTFVYGLRPNVPDAMVRGGNTYRILSDWHGSVRLVVDESSGQVVQQTDYDVWGNPTVQDTTCAAGATCALFQPFGFAGGLYDKETGLTRFGARDYDPATGRWTQKDASGLAAGTNVYAYAWNDPVTYIDLTGFDPVVDFAHWAVPVATTFLDFAGGVIDSASMGLLNPVSAALGITRSGSRCTGAYQIGSIAGLGVGMLMGVGGEEVAAETVAPSSRALGAALEEAGFVRGTGEAAHHIVAGSAEAAAPARTVLQRFGIGINDAANGRFLPGNLAAENAGGSAVHSTLHTAEYYRAVNAALGGATSREGALLILNDIGESLSGGGFP